MRWLALTIFVVAAGVVVRSVWADHEDSPSITEPQSDITDFYAWMTPDAAKLDMAMSVRESTKVDPRWSATSEYVFHVSSMAAIGGAETETIILCTVAPNKRVQCWTEGEYLIGGVSGPEGVVSQDGKLRVWIGARDDAAFVNRAGIGSTLSALDDARTSATLDQGCPTLDADTSNALLDGLKSGANAHAGGEVLTMVVEVDKALVNKGGPILSAWASTNVHP